MPQTSPTSRLVEGQYVRRAGTEPWRRIMTAERHEYSVASPTTWNIGDVVLTSELESDDWEVFGPLGELPPLQERWEERVSDDGHVTIVVWVNREAGPVPLRDHGFWDRILVRFGMRPQQWRVPSLAEAARRVVGERRTFFGATWVWVVTDIEGSAQLIKSRTGACGPGHYDMFFGTLRMLDGTAWSAS